MNESVLVPTQRIYLNQLHFDLCITHKSHFIGLKSARKKKKNCGCMNMHINSIVVFL